MPQGRHRPAGRRAAKRPGRRSGRLWHGNCDGSRAPVPLPPTQCMRRGRRKRRTRRPRPSRNTPAGAGLDPPRRVRECRTRTAVSPAWTRTLIFSAAMAPNRVRPRAGRSDPVVRCGRERLALGWTRFSARRSYCAETPRAGA